ncbi:MAG: sulfate ABC transporter substrate-binding protein [Pirellulales bacterium]
MSIPRPRQSVEILNVSYDPTRELWKELNDIFVPAYNAKGNVRLTIRQSHAGSSSQARSVIDGLEADVVTLAMWTDTDAIREKGLIAENWESRLPERSMPYLSTIVFVVRQGNPKEIKDWEDLARDDLQIVTPNPKTSGNGKLSFLAAWGAVVVAGGSDADALSLVTKLYKNTPVLDTAARAATTTFAQKGIGDVHLTWENEAYLEVQESRGELEIVYPARSIRAEPQVSLVDKNVDRHGTRDVSNAYLNFLYTDEAQRAIGRHYYRPINHEIRAEFAATLPDLELFTINDFTAGWADANQRFFGEGGVFDQIYASK